MTGDDLLRIANKMSAIPFFPEGDDALLAIAEDMADLCHNEEQAQWLAKRMRQLYTKWPGVPEMRAVFCAKFKPRDGIEAFSTVYLDGIPSEKPEEPVQLLPGRADLLLEGAAEEFRETISIAAAATRMDRAQPLRPPKQPAQPPEIPAEKRITQDNIDAAVDELHKAKENHDAAEVGPIVDGTTEGL